MNKKYFILILILVLPLFLIKSSNIELSIPYPDIELKSNNSIIINKTAYSFKDNFTVNAVAHGYSKRSFNFTHRDSEKLIVLDEVPVEVRFQVNIEDNYEIKINNTFFDKDDIFLLKGSYDYSIFTDGYLTFSSVLNIDTYSEKILVPVLLKKINKPIKIESLPSISSVILNGINIGNSPLEVNLTKKDNSIEIEKDGYEKTSFEIVVNDNNSEIIYKELVESEKLISIISSPSQAALFLDNEYIGLTPLNLKDNSRGQIKISKYGYEDFVYDLVDTKKNLNFKLNESISDVIINTDPSSDVFINGKFIGNTPLEIKLQQVKHEIVLKKDNYQTITSSIEPLTKNVSFYKKLITKKQSILNSSPKEPINSIGVELILFNPGKVVLGSSKKQSRRDINEVLRNVEISKHFYISKNLITENQFKNFLSTTKSSSLPVNNISWSQAAMFCNWLSKKEGFQEFYIFKGNKLISVNKTSNGYRLPTEAEWEYISKSNLKSAPIYHWGDNRKITKLVGNIADESTSSLLKNYVNDYNDGFISRSPVGSFKPNHNGIYDLTGNLSEWVSDFYSSDIVSNDIIFKDYIGPLFGSSHVIKGSNYNSSSPLQLGISYRTYGIDKDELVGFRVARWIY